ncbi:hypothetical protein LXL04_000531 [Taraxacum kok-saghyz]
MLSQSDSLARLLSQAAAIVQTPYLPSPSIHTSIIGSTLISELEGAFGATTTAPRLITVEAVSVHDFLPQFVELELQTWKKVTKGTVVFDLRSSTSNPSADPDIRSCNNIDDMFPFKLKRKQFPIRLSFAMTINKAQGQTIPNVGVYLPESVFSHDQLYVALSRGISRENTKVLVKPVKEFTNEGVYTSNVVAIPNLDESVEESSQTPFTNESIPSDSNAIPQTQCPNDSGEWKDLPTDLTDRQKITSFNSNVRDDVRRAYLVEGPCQIRLTNAIVHVKDTPSMTLKNAILEVLTSLKLSFSRIVKTDLCNKIGDEFLNNALICHIEPDIFVKVETEKVMKRFQNMSMRRGQI